MQFSSRYGPLKFVSSFFFRRRQNAYLPTGDPVGMPHFIRLFDVEFRV